MTINSSTTLLGSGPATALDRCFILGVGSTTSKVKELVTGVERDIVFSGSAARASGANGDYINSAATTDYATITDDFDPTGNDFTAGFVFDPATLNPAAWTGFFSWQVFASLICQLIRSGSTSNLRLDISGTSSAVTNGVSLFPTGLQGLVINYNSATSTAKVFTKGNAAQSVTSLSATTPSGTADIIKIWQTKDGDGSWTGKGYVWFCSDTVISDTDCQNIADSPEATLFAAAAAGGQPTVKRFGGIPGMTLNRGVW